MLLLENQCQGETFWGYKQGDFSISLSFLCKCNGNLTQSKRTGLFFSLSQRTAVREYVCFVASGHLVPLWPLSEGAGTPRAPGCSSPTEDVQWSK